MNRERSTNHFDLMKNEIECYNCHNFIHKDANFHLKYYKENPNIKPLSRNATTWKKKDSEKCGAIVGKPLYGLHQGSKM